MQTKTKRNSPKLESIRVRIVPDEDPDLSFLGRYTDSPTGEEERAGRVIDRFPATEGRGRAGEYRYFVAAMSAKESGNAESVRQDFERMESYNAGSWGMVGVSVEAEIIPAPSDAGHGLIQKVRSGGLWGVESDAGTDYLESIVRDELHTLRSELEALGVKLPKKLKAEADRDGFLSAPVEEK